MEHGPILSLDLASGLGSAAVWANGAIVGAARRRVVPAEGASHAALWRPLLVESLAVAGLTRQTLTMLAVTVGPGSFTGIRVAIAAMRGLGVGLDLPVWGESAFAVAAESVETNGRALLVALESGRGAFFTQSFAADGIAEGSPQDGDLADVAIPWLAQGTTLATGDSSALEHLAAAGFDCVIPTMDGASALATRIARLRESGVSIGLPLPLYIRPPDATPPAQGGRLRP